MSHLMFDPLTNRFAFDQLTNILKDSGYIGSFILFLIAVSTFYRTERWKRAEFLAQEMKEFFASAHVQRALLLIDWGERRIQLLEGQVGDQAVVFVDRPMQVRGLRPHILVTGNESDSETMAIRDGDGSGGFTRPEAAIRDCFDAFLDGLERFGRYVKTGLTDVASLRPYIGYWIDDISAPTNSPDDAAWSAAILTYICFYRFKGVTYLFSKFGEDIEPKSDLYRSFLSGMADQELAQALARSVDVEYAGTAKSTHVE